MAREDYERDIIDEDLTDARLYRHRAELYRRGLQPCFRSWAAAWLSRKAELPLFELECGWLKPVGTQTAWCFAGLPLYCEAFQNKKVKYAKQLVAI